MNILLVEDDILLAKGTANWIQRLSGYTVEVTTEPQEIFAQCRAGKVDLILMDINLPGSKWQGEDVSGVDLAYLLKSDRQTSHIPIIIVTAYAMLSERDALLKVSQADELFTKPINNHNKFIQVIEQLVGENN
ncbi:MAG: response regulator [Cyanobacteriota bacterium]|nr:response regulator [Cyanobacteriota bacterium]